MAAACRVIAQRVVHHDRAQPAPFGDAGERVEMGGGALQVAVHAGD
jgi:hypothetical protein